MAVTNNAGVTFAATFVQIHAEHNKLAFNHRFRILQNAFIRDMNKKIGEFNTPPATQLQKQANLDTEIRKLGQDQQVLARFANAIKVNINHMRKVSSALTSMSESRTPTELRVKQPMSIQDNTPDDIIRAAPGTFDSKLAGRLVVLDGLKGSGVDKGRYRILSVSGDGSEVTVQNLDGADAKFPPGAGVQPANARMQTPPIFDSKKKEMTFSKDADGNNIITAAPGTFSDSPQDLKDTVISLGGTAGLDKKYAVTEVSEDGSTLTVTKKNGKDAGFTTAGVTESDARIKLQPTLRLKTGPGGLTFIDGGVHTGDDTITVDPAVQPQAFKEFSVGDRISVPGAGVLKISAISPDKSTISVQSRTGGIANLKTTAADPAKPVSIRQEPVIERMAFQNNGKDVDDSIRSVEGAFESVKAGDTVVLYSHKNSANKGEFRVTGVSKDFAEIFVRKLDGDDAGFKNEKAVLTRQVRKKPAASTVDAKQVQQFEEARDYAVKHLKAIQQQVHPQISDAGLAARIGALFKKFEAMKIAVGDVMDDPSKAAAKANYDTFEEVGKLTIELSNAQISSTYVLQASNTLQRTIRRKSRDAQAEMHALSGVQQAEAAREIQKLRQTYASILDGISLAYDAQAKMYNELAVSFAPRRNEPGSVLNLFS